MRAMVEALNRVEDSMVSPTAAAVRPTRGSRGCSPPKRWMSAREAVDLGFADRVAAPVKIAAAFDLSKFSYKHPPQPNPAAGWDKVISAKFSKLAG